MTCSIPRLATAGVTALAIIVAACASQDPGVETGRSDRTRAAAEPVPATADIEPATTTASSTTTAPETEPPNTEAPAETAPPATTPADTSPPDTAATDRPPAPPASGIGSVSADDLASVFLPSNPELLSPSLDLTDGRDSQTFLDEEMTFTGMDPVIEVAGAPLTQAAHVVFAPTFDDDGATTSAIGVRAFYRLAVEFDEADITDATAEALRDELRPIVEAANPGEVVTDTLGTAALGNSIFGLRVGPEESPTTTIEIQQHYVILPRPVMDPLLSINVIRTAVGDVSSEELPARERFIDDDIQTQIDLFETVESPISEPRLRSLRVFRNIPSAGAATIVRGAEYEVVLTSGGFEGYVDAVGAVVEADEYRAVDNFGDKRAFEHVVDRIDSEFVVARDGDESAIVNVLGDTTAYSG